MECTIWWTRDWRRLFFSVNVRLRDSGVPSEGQLRAFPSVGFGLSDGFFLLEDKDGFQPIRVNGNEF
jgi:hypothetical protein